MTAAMRPRRVGRFTIRPAQLLAALVGTAAAAKAPIVADVATKLGAPELPELIAAVCLALVAFAKPAIELARAFGALEDDAPAGDAPAGDAPAGDAPAGDAPEDAGP